MSNLVPYLMIGVTAAAATGVFFSNRRRLRKKGAPDYDCSGDSLNLGGDSSGCNDSGSSCGDGGGGDGGGGD